MSEGSLVELFKDSPGVGDPTLKDLVLGMSNVLGRVEREVEELVGLRRKVELLEAAVLAHTEAVNKLTYLFLSEFNKNVAVPDPSKG